MNREGMEQINGEARVGRLQCGCSAEGDGPPCAVKWFWAHSLFSGNLLQGHHVGQSIG